MDVRLAGISPQGRRSIRRIAIGAALVGLVLGFQTLAYHAARDPFADTRLYYDAAARLNAGQPLYIESAIPGIGPYINPPLLAILFRPLALLPFALAAAVWEVVLVLAIAISLRRIGLREPVVIAVGCLALPLMWALTIGQAEILITLLLTLGTPASIALAGNLKLVPFVAAIYWVGRRDLRSLGRLAGFSVALVAVQLVLEPAATIDYMRLEWLRTAFDFRSISPYAIHPVLWGLVVAVLVLLALRYAPTRLGWPLAVVLAVFAYPRLLVYQLTSLLAAFGGASSATAGREIDRGA